MASRAQQLRAALQCSSRARSARLLNPHQRTISDTPRVRTEAHKQEKDEIVVESQEYSKSGFDSWAAETENTAFTKHKNKPEEERADAGQESERIGQQNNPLDVSPANKEVSSTFEFGDEPVPQQSKVAGQESKRTAAPKKKALPRYDERGDETNFRGTGSIRTQNQEKPGPAFPAAQKHNPEESVPADPDRRKYVGSGR